MREMKGDGRKRRDMVSRGVGVGGGYEVVWVCVRDAGVGKQQERYN